MFEAVSIAPLGVGGKKAVNGSKVLFLGVAYKPNINDERESLPREIRSKFHRGPALEIMDITTHKGGEVQFHDPYIPSVETSGHASDGLKLNSLELTAENLKAADVVVLTTNHSVFNIDFIKENARLIVDLRNMITESSEKVYKL